MTTVDERQAFAKLEALKDIRSKTISLEKIRLRLLHDADSVENEDKCLSEYRREMELLQQEKMAHVEELRQIHADINAMETVIKQAEEAKRNSQESARRMLDDYRPLKHEVDLMRTELLGLDRLPDLPDEEKEKLSGLGILEKPKNFPMDVSWPPHHTDHMGRPDPDKPFASLMMSSLGRQSAGAPNPFLAAAAAQHSAMGLGPLPGMGGPKPTGSGGPPHPAPPPFRQQPPPMKSCLSCHQQIHRNAPICPLCKAKSRSRNPKKPKKKD